MAKAADKTKQTEAPKAPEVPQMPVVPVVRAKARYVRVAPRKARLVADQVRGMPVDQARTLLAFSPRGAALDLARLLDSAAANAEANHDLVAEDLRISEICVDEGPTLKRWRARARGRATPIHKRTSHLSVALTPTLDA
jgi:ribosomal protein L22